MTPFESGIEFARTAALVFASRIPPETSPAEAFRQFAALLQSDVEDVVVTDIAPVRVRGGVWR